MLAVTGRNLTYVFNEQPFKFTPENFRRTRGRILSRRPSGHLNNPFEISVYRCPGCKRATFGNVFVHFSGKTVKCTDPHCEREKLAFWQANHLYYYARNHPTFCNHRVGHNNCTSNLNLYVKKKHLARVTLINPDPTRWSNSQLRQWLNSSVKDHLWYAYKRILKSPQASLQDRAAASIALQYVKNWLDLLEAENSLRPKWSDFVTHVTNTVPNSVFVGWICDPRIKYLGESTDSTQKCNTAKTESVVVLKHRIHKTVILNDIWEFF